MSKNILTESTKSRFKVLEHKPKNVLKRIQGVLSDFKSNRNGRVYPRELWENVLNSDYVKEMIENHGLVGELDHPEERLEISLQNVSHVINDMWIEGDQVIGTIDILPTPSGKIVSELLDYGTDIGISSRGAGSVLSDNSVDPTDYQFVTFDFVARPSCEAARLNMIVESVQPEINTNSDDKVNSILESYKSILKEDSEKSNISLIDKYKLNGDDSFRYMMLSRLQSDCKYVLNNELCDLRHLWVVDDPKTHCELMRELYKSLPEEPDWITLEDIDTYEKEMLEKCKSNINEAEEPEETIENKYKFTEFCKDKLSNLGTIKVQGKDIKIAFIQDIRDFGKCYVLDPDDTINKLDSDGDSLEFVVDKDKSYVNTPMITTDILVSSLEFDKIDENFYNNIINYWEDLNMDENMEGTLMESVEDLKEHVIDKTINELLEGTL